MSNHRIMIVEDEEVVAADIGMSVEKIGYTVCATASSGLEAIDKAESTRPDLVLMDIVLKGSMDGIEAATRIKELYQIPVVYLTAFGADDMIQQAKVAEPYGYITKPFRDRELHIAIEIGLYKKEAEARIQKVERWLATVLKSIGDAVIASDQERRITFMNAVAERLTGWSQEEALGKKLTEILNINNLDPADLDKYLVQKVISEGQVVNLLEDRLLIRKDGLEIPISGSAAPIKEDNGALTPGSVLVFRDITASKLAEKVLEKRIMALTQPLEGSVDITFEDLFNLEDIQRLQNEFALATGVASIITHTDGTPITAPSNFCHLCRDIIRKTERGLANCYQSDALLGKLSSEGPIIQQCMSGGLWDAGAGISVGGHHIANWLIGQVRDETQTEERMREYARQIGVDEKVFMEAFYEVPAMSREQFGKVAKVLFTLANQLSSAAYHNVQQARFITERKQAIEKINNQKEFLQTTLESLPYPFYVIDAANYEVLTANSVAVADGKEWQGKKCYQLSHNQNTPCDAPEHICPLMKVKVTKKPMTTEHIHYDAKGRKRFVEVNGFPVFDKKGEVVQLIEYTKDITELREAEKEKVKFESQLRQAHKMEAIGTMAGGIAHDFNNILAAILGYADMAKDDLPNSSPAKHDIEQVLKAGNRAKDLVRHILTFSRMSGLDQDHRPINLAPIVKEVLKFQRSIIPTTIEIIADIDKNCGQINGDQTQIHQILMNLCTNAAQVMEEKGGTLKVTLHKTELSSSSDLKTEAHLHSGNYIHLSIGDTGAGLAPELIDKIFDPYFTTKEVGKGSGMGLAVVKGIVKTHGGFIKVESVPGKGSTFNVFFPRIEEAITAEESVDAEAMPTGTERILFVDDEEMLVDIGKSTLERLGYFVTAVTDSTKALALFQSDPSQFDLVITDQTMPNIPGSELAKQLLEIRSDIPIILCTGYSSLIDEIKTQKIGIREYAMKPVNKKEIARLVRKVLAVS